MGSELEKNFDTIWKTLDLDSIAAKTGQLDKTISAGLEGDVDQQTGLADLQIIGHLGEGGMGVVKLARQPSLHREVAVKTLRDKVLKHEMEQLLREARVTGLLEHPNIVPVYSLIEAEGGVPMMVMKRIEGTSWRDTLLYNEGQSLVGVDDPLRYHLRVLMQVASATHYAHSMGILHRDIKTENVMLGPYQEVYLMDWGCAVSLDTVHRGWLPMASDVRALVGTPAYAAPEMMGGELSERTDVYLLGSALHEVLTQRPRHEGTNLHAVLYRVFKSEPIDYPEHVPKQLAAIANKATNRDAEQRFNSAEEFRKAIDDFLRLRSTIELISEATTQLDAMELLIKKQRTEEVSTESIYRRFGECRFGLKQALRGWPDNSDARGKLQAATETMVVYELNAGQEERAALLLADLPKPNPDLEQRIDQARQERRDGEQRLEELKQLERDVDLSIGRGQRSRYAILIGFLWAFPPVIFWFLERWNIYKTQYWDSFMAAMSFLITVSVVVYLKRDKLLQNMASKRLTAAVVLGGAFIVVLRVAGWAVRMPMLQMFMLDILLCMAMFSLIVVAYDFRLLAGALPWLVALLLSLAWPEYLILFEAGGIFLSFVIIGLIWHVDEVRASKEVSTGSNLPQTR